MYRFCTTSFLVCLSIVLFCGDGALAEDLEGRIILSNNFLKAVRYTPDRSPDFYWNEPNGILNVREPGISFADEFAAVLIPPSATVAPPDNLLSISIKNAEIEKEIITVHKGTTIRFRNEEPFVHELYSPDIPDFQPEMQSTNAVRQIVFDTLGAYEIRCRRMPHILSYVLVLASPFILDISKDGSFAISNIVPGQYTLKIFFKGQWIHEEIVEIKEKVKNVIKVELKTPEPEKEKKG